MSRENLEGMYLNAHIRDLLDGQFKDATRCSHDTAAAEEHCSEDHGGGVQPYASPKQAVGVNGAGGVGGGSAGADPTLEALKGSLEQAKKMFESAQKALDTYKSIHGESGAGKGLGNGAGGGCGVTSREMSGEMGGDTAGTDVQVFAGGIVNVGV